MHVFFKCLSLFSLFICQFYERLHTLLDMYYHNVFIVINRIHCASWVQFFRQNIFPCYTSFIIHWSLLMRQSAVDLRSGIELDSCSAAPGHYLNWFWLVIHEVLWQSHELNLMEKHTLMAEMFLKIALLKLQTYLPGANKSTHWDLNKMILQMTFLNAFSSQKIWAFWF